ncbi:hypothetical protein TNCV_1305541 [Trichonephila clavipes]|nr:hypothetical protein TNCV_1305541 [Trichonephila clavipes]
MDWATSDRHVIMVFRGFFDWRWILEDGYYFTSLHGGRLFWNNFTALGRLHFSFETFFDFITNEVKISPTHKAVFELSWIDSASPVNGS